MSLRNASAPNLIALIACLGLAALAGACATLPQVVQPPTFEFADGRASEVRLLTPAIDRPLGGAQVRVWARVRNPNPVGLTLSRLAGDVLLDGRRAADVDLPLGLPLRAAADTVLPLDVSVSFADLPDLANALADAVGRGTVHYALEGTLAVDAGPFGEPAFGPTTWLSGDVSIVR